MNSYKEQENKALAEARLATPGTLGYSVLWDIVEELAANRPRVSAQYFQDQENLETRTYDV